MAPVERFVIVGTLADEKLAAATPADRAHSVNPIWLATFCLVLAFGATDTDRFGITSTSDLLLWTLIRMVFYSPGVFFALASVNVRSVAGTSPLAPLLGSMVLMVAIAPAGEAGVSDVLIAMGLFGFVALGAWSVLQFGWATLMRLSGGTLLVFLTTGMLAQLVMESSPRWQGWAVHANRLGLVAALAVAIGLGLVGRSRIAPPLLVVAIVNLLMTNSRTAMLAGSIAVLLWLSAITRRRVGALAVGLVVVAVLATLATGAIETVSEAASRSGEAEEVETLAGRVEIWGFVVDEIAKRPFTGIGAGSTNQFMDDAFAKGEIGFSAGHAHNAVLQAALSGGMPVAFLYVLSLVAYVASRGRAICRPERDGIVAVMMTVGLTEDLMATPHAAFVLLGAALASVAAERSGAVQEVHRAPHKVTRTRRTTPLT